MINIPKIDFRKDKTQFTILVILAGAVILALDLFLFVRPQITTLTDILSKTGKLNAEYKAAESAIARIDSLRANIDIYKKKIDTYEKRLPAEQEIPSLLESLSNLAKRSNINIVAITPVAPAAKSEKDRNFVYQEMPILISAKSGYHELGAFLSELESSDRFMKVVDIDVRSSRASPKKHDVELLVCTYLLFAEK